MKSLLRRIIPVFVWDTCRYIKSYSIGSRHDISIFTVMKIAFREYGGSTGMLDYTKKHISIVLHSFTELARLTPYKKEPKTVAWIESEIRTGDVFYDIGANVGAYALIAHAYTKGVSMSYAFEPNPFTFTSLSHNIVRNNASGRIIPLAIALSDKTQISSFTYSQMTPGSAQHTLHDSLNMSDTDTQPVLVYTLDKVIRTFKLASPTMIKIDVDGVERGVLLGAYDTLRVSTLRSVLIEIDFTQKSHSEEMERIMKDAGFTLKEKHPLGKGSSTTLFNCVFTK